MIDTPTPIPTSRYLKSAKPTLDLLSKHGDAELVDAMNMGLSEVERDVNSLQAELAATRKVLAAVAEKVGIGAHELERKLQEASAEASHRQGIKRSIAP